MMGAAELQTLLNVGLSTACAVIGWFARELWTAVQVLKDDVYKLREEIAKDYMPKDEFVAFKRELFTMLHRIEDKIEKKEDR
jgi:hypothetical protein